MATKYFVQSMQVPDRAFEILGIDKETKTATLQGSRSTFEQPIDPGTLEGFGYKIVKREETDDAEQP